MAEQSLITDEVRSHIGRTTDLRPVVVTTEAVARAAGVYGGAVPQEGIAPGFVLMNLGPEGQSLRLPDLMPASLLVSNEFALERPLTMGEELQARSRIADISERLGGQFGHGIYVRTDVEFFDAGGALVGRSASTLMYYDPAGGRQRDGGQ
jgi:hypothetical protein